MIEPAVDEQSKLFCIKFEEFNKIYTDWEHQQIAAERSLFGRDTLMGLETNLPDSVVQQLVHSAEDIGLSVSDLESKYFVPMHKFPIDYLHVCQEKATPTLLSRDTLMVCTKNPFAYRSANILNALRLCAKIAANGGWRHVACSPGVGIWITHKQSRRLLYVIKFISCILLQMIFEYCA